MGSRRMFSTIGFHDGQTLPSASLPSAALYRPTAQAIPNSVLTHLAFTHTEWNNGITVSGDGTTFTLTSGLWAVVASVRFLPEVAGSQRFAGIIGPGGVSELRWASLSERPNHFARSLCVVAHISVATTQAVAVRVWQDSGRTVDLDPAWNANRVQIAYLGK